jgi:hypothetical protein
MNHDQHLAVQLPCPQVWCIVVCANQVMVAAPERSFSEMEEDISG